MFDEPITTISQAKEFFRGMGCSHFHMVREFPQRFEEYQQLKIPRQTEREWTQERFDEDFVSIINQTDSSTLWLLHSRMYDLFENLRTNVALTKMLEVTRHISDKVPLEDRIIVAETINGRGIRRIRSGLIYGAYDLKNISAAKAFVELSLHFSIYDVWKNRGIKRSEDAVNLCNAIKLELGL